MHREWLDNGCLRIWLTETEARSIGITFDEQEPSSAEEAPFSLKTAVGHLLADAVSERPRYAAHSWEVEALPIDGGCILLCTPRRVRAVRRKTRSRGPFVLHLSDTEALFELARGLRRRGDHEAATSSSLFAFGDEYRLILAPTDGILPPFFREFSVSCEEGAAAAAAVAEHGKPLALQDALQTIADRLSPPN